MLAARTRSAAARRDADARMAAGDRTGARRVLQAALVDARAQLAENDPELVLLYNHLGVVEKFFGAFDEAARHYAHALECLEDAPDDDPQAAELRAALFHNLGGLAHSMGHLAGAEKHTRRALGHHVRLFGEDHPRTAADRGQLGSILSELGRHDEAIDALRRSAEAFERAGDELEVAIARTTLAAALHRAGRLVEAEAAYLEGLRTRQALQGDDHPELAPTLLNLGRLAADRGDHEAARAHAQQALRVLEGRVADDHPFLQVARERSAAAAR